MEGVGSRLGRASSRYGPAATVFNGPVRKWKKKWVQVSSSATVSYQNPQSQSNGSPRLLLCRWTPLPPSSTAAAVAAGESGSGSGSEHQDEPPRRKFRYTPIVVLEEQKKVAEKKVEDDEKTTEADQSPVRPTIMSDEMLEKPNIAEFSKKETELVIENNGSEGSNTSNFDLGLDLTGPDDNLDTVSETKETQMDKASQAVFGQWGEA